VGIPSPSEATFRGRRNARLQYAVLAAAAVHGGSPPALCAPADAALVGCCGKEGAWSG